MKIYIGHPSSIDFQRTLYRPLRESHLDEEHEIVLPHENSAEPFNSKRFLSEECEMMVAEVSQPSTGLGIELGWADYFGVPLLCIHREGTEPSSSLPKVSDRIEEYGDAEEMIHVIEEAIE